MHKCGLGLILVLIGFFTQVPLGHSESDDALKSKIIQDSISRYPGNCPCPYNLDRAGRRCGKRSAYSKPGGHAPVCYPSDVTEKMIEDYLKEAI